MQSLSGCVENHDGMSEKKAKEKKKDLILCVIKQEINLLFPSLSRTMLCILFVIYDVGYKSGSEHSRKICNIMKQDILDKKYCEFFCYWIINAHSG